MLKYDNNPIDKDQCYLCFRTPFDAEGLYISPKCHRSYCPSHIKEHHDKHKDDDLYVHLTKLKKKKKKEDTERPEKIIKLEIRQESESELYDVVTELVHYDGKDFTMITPSSADIATMDKIVNSNSTAHNQEVQTWTQEITPCEHTIDFTQTPIANDFQLKHCAQCELEENLWICLTCGQLGCGRAQFGGVPGNTHALKHYEDVGHPIAVKLGSLSKEVTDVYCYQCNDDIKVDNLASYLSTFGIDLNNFTKTEKSLVELQIEQNLQWEFNMKSDSGEDLPSVMGPGLTGLKNLGNSCYLSSCLQVLFALPEFQSLQSQELDEDSNDLLRFQLIKLAKGLLSGDFAHPNEEGYQNGISPVHFKNLIGANHEEFQSMRQQDAFEFWNYLLDKLENLSLNLDVFKFVIVEKLKFDDNSVSLKNQLTENITLPVKIELDYTDIEDGIKYYKRQDFIDSLISYLSPEEIDYKDSTIEKSTFFKTFPKYLITSIQRIQLENWIPIKTDVPINLPQVFDLKDYQPNQILENDEAERIEDDEEEEIFIPNEDSFDQLLQMGFTELRAKKALYSTGNSSAEVAMEWLIQHLDDPTIDNPIEFKLKNDTSVDESQIANLQDMGFSYKLAKKALFINKGDANASVEWLFSNPDDDGELPTMTDSLSKLDEILKSKDDGSKYSLKAVICHKGTQVTSGHYVAFIKQSNNEWILFNDEKVVNVTGDSKSWKEIEQNGYVYVWEKID